MEGQYNLKSPAVKRLMREARELCEATSQYYAQPLEDNLFEWHFTVQGPIDSEFEKGRYHGRIILPPEYPMKPPSIMLLTPNGRFELNKKICLSMSAHHPETWQPSWSIRTVLLAIIGFMPSKGGGAIGALDYTSEERRILAKKSMRWTCDVCGSCNGDSLREEDSKDKGERYKRDIELASQINFKGENEAKSEEKTKVDGSVATANGEITTNRQNIENILSHNEGATERTQNVRKRTRKTSSRRQESKHRTTESAKASHSKGYLSLILILIFMLCLLMLLLRRIYYK
ncbi:ubiquitin-conjugating enzyme E2 J1-like [Dendronephthya gigantea]|uniref:ubiquitin-conjugating enzyme E2 J1-like n=1 Tax=Dendronephthya gigantea TaxID=151771 RepID=UPI00106B4BAE|nr:ubiquitin-conjugating enzyme E2 J1-like [Dendronephthya gigantea]